MNRQPEFKVAVSLMKQFCQKHNITITHGQLLELAAIDRGYTNYHVYCAQEQKSPSNEKINKKIVSDFLSIQQVFKPIRYPSHDKKMMYEQLNNSRKDDSMAHVLSMLPAKMVYSKKELFKTLLGDFRWGRINGVAGEMRVNVENMQKLIEGKANFEDEIISFYYAHPFPETQGRYQPETISIIAHVMEMITYLNYGQWYIPGIGCVNFNSQTEELTSTELKTTLEQVDKKHHDNFNIFINGEMVIDSVCDLARAIEHTNSIAEDSIFGGIAELRDAVSHELIYFHAYGYQLPKKQKDFYSKIQRNVDLLDGPLDKRKITLPAIDPATFQDKKRSEILNRLRVGSKNKK